MTVSGTVSGGNNVAAPSSATLTLTDDDAAPGVTLSLSSSSISENGGVSTVTATLSGASSAATTVSVTAVSDFYTVGSDATITIAAGETANASDTATIAAVDDDTHQGSGGRSTTVTATVANTQGAGSVTGASLTLTDDEGLPTVALALSPSSVSESSGVSTVTATLDRTSSAAVTVTVGAAAGAGAVAADFTLSSADTLTIASGETTSTGTVTVTANGNSVDSPNKSVTVSGTVSGGNGVAAPSGVTLTLRDDEALPTVTLALSSATIDESGSSNVSTVTATLSGVSSAAVTVTVGAAPGVDTATGDYMLSATTALTIAAGATTSTGAVTITAVDNNDDEPNKSVAVSGTASGGNGVGNPTGKTLTIRDDEGPPLVTLALSSATIGESGASNAATVTATLNRASSVATTITVSAAPGVGTAFTLSANKTLTIASGDTTSAGTVTVTAVNDTTDSPDKIVTVSGSASNSVGVTQPSGVTLTITDDDAAPGVALSLSPSSVSENGGVSTVTAVLTHPSSASTTVTVTAVSGLYTVGSDTTITIAAGQTATADTAAITAVNDDVDNASNRSGTVTGTAMNSQGVGAVTGATLTLADDDITGFTVSPPPSTSLRLRTTESGGRASFTVALSSKPTGDVRLGVASSDTAEGTVSPSSLTFTAMNWNSAQTVSLTGVDDAPANPADGNKDYTVTLTVDTANTVDARYGALSPVAVYAVNADNEYGLDVSAVTGQPTEDGGTATFTVALVTQPSAAVTVAATILDTSEGSASPSSLTFTAADWNTAQTVTVTGVDDAIDDGDVAWAVRLDVSSGDANYDGLEHPELPMTTTDNDDTPTAELSLSPSSISENGGVSTVTATLNRASSAATTVTVSASPGAGMDFTLSSANTLTIAAGAMRSAGTVTITAKDNDVDAPDKSVTVSGAASGDSGVAAPSSVALTLTDDDVAGFVFDLADGQAGRLIVTAGGAASTYTAKLSSEPTGAVTVSIVSDNGDVTVSPDSLTFEAANWAVAQTVTVTAAADDDDFADRATLSHRGEGGGYDGVEDDVPVAVAGGARIAASGGGSGTPRVYVVNGHLVTVTEEAGVPPGVEIDLASSNLAEDVSVTFKPVEEDTPRESESFSLEHSGAGVMVDVDVTPAPKDGVKLCLTPPAGMREAARRASGRDVELLHYTGGSWTAVAGSSWDESRSQVCGTVTTFSDFSAGYARTKPVFEATQRALVFTVDDPIDPAVTLPAATGGNGRVALCADAGAAAGAGVRRNVSHAVGDADGGVRSHDL